jgi:hypothetical protein
VRIPIFPEPRLAFGPSHYLPLKDISATGKSLLLLAVNKKNSWPHVVFQFNSSTSDSNKHSFSSLKYRVSSDKTRMTLHLILSDTQSWSPGFPITTLLKVLSCSFFNTFWLIMNDVTLGIAFGAFLSENSNELSITINRWVQASLFYSRKNFFRLIGSSEDLPISLPPNCTLLA